MLHMLQIMIQSPEAVKDSVYNSMVAPKIVTSLPFIGSIIGSALLGTLKKFVMAEDSMILTMIKPFQPIIVTTIGVLVPVLAGLFHFDAASLSQALLVAPLGTIAAITLRELNAKLSTKK